MKLDVLNGNNPDATMNGLLVEPEGYQVVNGPDSQDLQDINTIISYYNERRLAGDPEALNALPAFVTAIGRGIKNAPSAVKNAIARLKAKKAATGQNLLGRIFTPGRPARAGMASVAPRHEATHGFGTGTGAGGFLGLTTDRKARQRMLIAAAVAAGAILLLTKKPARRRR